MTLRDFSIRNRLAVGFGAIVLVMQAVALGATLFGQSSRDQLARVIEAASAKEAIAAEMKSILHEQQSVMRNVGLRTEVDDMQADEDRAKELGRTYDAAIAKMGKLAVTADERAIIARLRTANAQIEAPLREVLALATGFHAEAAAQIIGTQLDPTVRKTLAALNRLIELQSAANAGAIHESRVTGDRVVTAVYVVEALFLVLSVLVAWMVTRSITVPIEEAVAVARRVALGDLTSRIEPTGRDEAAQLLSALREMNDALARMVAHIRAGSDSIAAGASQVASGNQQLSSRTEEHASSLEETASTLEEFTTTVRQNAEHAKQATHLAGTASESAERGGEAVSHVVTTMKGVSSASKRVADIVGVIDGLSFQTNILALNAAVEAARAGEHGRGFAVVASEVRNLAQRSASSAKEIRGLIEDSVGQVEASVRLVEQAGRTMDDLVGSVKSVAEIMDRIATASHDQSSGIEQINKAVTQMEGVMQMNAALVEEASAAATSMATQASGLAQAVAQFRVDAGTMPLVPAMPTAGPPIPARRSTPAREIPRPAETALLGQPRDWREF